MGEFVDKACALQDLVRSFADQNEQQRYLSAPLATAFSEAGLYRVAAPRDCFGSEQPPREQIGVIEALAYADGSAAWNVMIGIESFGLIAPAFSECRDLIESPDVILASSTAAVGQAVKVDGGYRVSGQWPFASGVHNAQIFGATVRVHDTPDGPAQGSNRYAILPVGDYEILDTWHTSGMRGSGSHDVKVDDVFVPEARLIAPLGGVEHASPLLNFPLGARLAYNKVGVAWGIARAAIDAFVELAQGKTPRFSNLKLRDRPGAHRAVAQAEVRLRGGKALVLQLLDEMWVRVQARSHITRQERALFQIACSDAVAGCIDLVDNLARTAGTTANQLGHPLERLLRDVRVVGQHTTVAPQHIEDGGRLLLGLPAQEMMLAGLPPEKD
ncbi:MAG: acyl-CoA dehydrogenase family protein [Pseudomonadales bacterium]